jgi:hypothetical protein
MIANSILVYQGNFGVPLLISRSASLITNASSAQCSTRITARTGEGLVVEHCIRRSRHSVANVWFPHTCERHSLRQLQAPAGSSPRRYIAGRGPRPIQEREHFPERQIHNSQEIQESGHNGQCNQRLADSQRECPKRTDPRPVEQQHFGERAMGEPGSACLAFK